MGGQLFQTPGPNGQPGLNVPRLSNEPYQKLKKKCHTILSEFYESTRTPVEAPGKTNHGDIDVLVAGPKMTVTSELLVQRLSAARVFTNGPTTSLAIPMPDSEDAYFQLDVHVCPTDLFEWECFHHSYGDLWQIFGVCFRKLGLTANDKGLHLRVEEIEPLNRKASMIFLSKDPAAVMDFFGLDSEVYARGFNTEGDLFSWATSSRFFSRELLESRLEKANDRQRNRKRGMYMRFLNEWMAENVDSGSEQHLWTREEVLSDTLDHFSRHEDYDEKMQRHKLSEAEKDLWLKIKELLQEKGVQGERLGCTIRGLKKWSVFERGKLELASEPQQDEEKRPLWILETVRVGIDEEQVLDWVRRNWEEAKTREKSWSKRKKMDGLQAKGLMDEAMNIS